MAEHSPTPWRLHAADTGYYIGNDSVLLGKVWSYSNDGQLAPSHVNAALIVKAVNSHDALVKALEAAKASFDQMARESGLMSPQDETAHELVIAALKLARGELPTDQQIRNLGDGQ